MERSDQLIYDYLMARKKHFQMLIRQIIFRRWLQAVASRALLAIGGWLVISGQLSLGQLVAAELIVAVVVGSFAGAPEIVLLDEILDSLSDTDAARILQRIAAAERPWTIVLVTNRERLKSLMDGVIELTAGPV